MGDCRNFGSGPGGGCCGVEGGGGGAFFGSVGFGVLEFAFASALAARESRFFLFFSWRSCFLASEARFFASLIFFASSFCSLANF